MNPHCRISKVRPKNAPHLVEIIPAVRGREFEAEMHRSLDTIFDWAGPDGIAGVAVVAFTFKGHYNRAVRVHPEACFGQTMFPALVAEVLRRDTTRDVAVGVMQGDE